MAAADISSTASPIRPYMPSWFDRFTDWVDSLTIPASAFYAVLALILAGVQFVIQWGSGGTVAPFPVIYLLTLAYDLALMHHLDKVAGRALVRFRSVLAIDDAEYEDLRYRLTTLPARPVLFVTALGMLYGILMLELIPFEVKTNDMRFVDTPLSVHFNNAMTLPIWGIIFLVIYHTAHQLRIVQQIYNRCASVDLYVLHPLYAFSTLSAQTAVGIVFVAYLWNVFAPQLVSITVSLGGFLFITGFSLFTFVYPLLGAHRLLAEEKNRRLAKNGERQRAAIAELHRRIDNHDLVDMDNLNKTLVSLELEHASLSRISTWPWQPETLRGVMAALFFPVMVWLTQWVLQRMLEA